MELVRKKADVEEERNSEYCLHNEHGGKGSAMIPSETSLVETSARPSSSNPKHSTSSNQEYQLESTKAEMFEVREENERLKMTLTQIIKDYKSLQMYFSNVIVQQQAQAKITVEETPADDDDAEEIVVALSLGTSSSTGQKKEDKIKTMTGKDSEKFEEGLTLGLDCKFEGSSNSLNEPVLNLSPDNNSEDIKEEDTGMPWPPSKTLKSPRNGDDEASQQPQVKKARVSIRTRCDGPTMNDGCQWRKYGQKISKGNPCPRAYYRCTISPACPVRKQVQRCVEDMSILITTYEGTHNHLLPVAATAMASTTAAAASMLMSGPSASQPAIGLLASSSITTNSNANNFHSPSFSISDNMRWKQFYLPNPSSSSTSSHPTITLDLTAPPSCSSQANLFSRFSSNFTTTPWYSSTSFNLSSSESNSLPTSWSNRYLNYGAQPYNKSSISMSLGRQSQAPFYRSYLQMATNPSAPAAPNHHPLSDTIAKAITLDPKFHSALTAAITSYVEARGGKNGGEGLGHSLKWGEHLDSLPASAAPLGINACATSYLNKSTGLNLNTQQGSLLLQSSLGFSINKSASTSPEDHNKGNIN